MQTLGGNTTNVTTISLLILIINNIHEVLYSKLSFSNANPIFIHAGTTCSVNFWRRVSTSPRWSWYAIYILKVIQYAWKSSLFSFFKTINPCFLLTTKAMVPNKLNGIYLFDFGTMALPLTTNYLTIALFLTKLKKITKEWENFFFLMPIHLWRVKVFTIIMKYILGIYFLSCFVNYSCFVSFEFVSASYHNNRNWCSRPCGIY